MDHCVIAMVHYCWDNRSLRGPLCHCKVLRCVDHIHPGLYMDHCVAGFGSVRTAKSVHRPLCNCRGHCCQNHMVCTWTIV